MSSTEKSSYLILGGCGFIGRNLVAYLIENELASKIRVADKLQPKLAYFNKHHETVFTNPIVEFVSSNLLLKDSQEKVFTSAVPFDFVINCAGETRYGLSEAVYNDGIYNLTISCAHLAAKYDVRRFVEISTGYSSPNSEVQQGENVPANPSNVITRFKLKTEKALTTIPSLRYTILKSALVYGIGDKTAITPRLIIAAIYRYLGETMKILWHRDLFMNTVHVYDLCRAIHFVVHNPNTLGEIYNVVDEGRTTQGTVNDIVAKLFDIKTVYIDTIITTLFKDKFDFEAIAEEINDKHSSPWAHLCLKNNITCTPLSSFIHKEELEDNHLSLDGTKLIRLGFSYIHPKITKELVEAILNDYVERNLFPKDIVPK